MATPKEKSPAPAKRRLKSSPRAGQPRGHRVVFRYHGDPGHQVTVAGTFNDWDPQARPLVDKEGNGEYTVCFLLKNGTYQYKLVVDGQWILDPTNPVEAPNDFGGSNNVIVVGPQ
ncbi:MAG: glycogen-binding domain-containing protein [Oligosphaeraceae bacterium]